MSQLTKTELFDEKYKNFQSFVDNITWAKPKPGMPSIRVIPATMFRVLLAPYATQESKDILRKVIDSFKIPDWDEEDAAALLQLAMAKMPFLMEQCEVKWEKMVKEEAEKFCRYLWLFITLLMD